MRIVAPGKLVLVGEYAVVDGGPAVVAAVDRGVACEVQAAPELAIETPGDDRFVRAALTAAGAPPVRYVFSDWNPVDAPEKVGLGGSAAATVAAVLAADPTRDAAARHAIAQRVHREVQGSGSGVDVAASTFGGVSRFEGGGVIALPPVAPVVVFAGRSAHTGPRVKRYLEWAERSEFVSASRAIVDGFAAEPVRALRAAGRLLRAMSAAAGIDYWTAEIDAVVRVVEAHGGACKPSGAGGGDVLVALFPDPDRQEACTAALTAAGWLVIGVNLAAGAAVVG